MHQVTHFKHGVLLSCQFSGQQNLLGATAMTKRPFYLLASMLLLASLLTGLSAQTMAFRVARFAAIATSVDGDEDRLVLRLLSLRALAEHRSLAITSLAILVCGATAWILSRRRREGGLQSVPLVLTIFTVVIQFLLV
jgi:hypothetical protein